MNYKPGLLMCPRTFKLLNYEDVKDKVEFYSKLPLKQKLELKVLQLDNIPKEEKTE